MLHYNIQYDLRPVTPMVSLDTGRDTVEGDLLAQIDEMRSVVTGNLKFREALLDVKNHDALAEAGIVRLNYRATPDDEKYDMLVEVFDRMVNLLAEADYTAFVDGETNGFYIFYGPFVWDASDGEHNIIEEGVAGPNAKGWGIDDFPTKEAAIVHCLEQYEHEGIEMETFVLIGGMYYHVENYKQTSTP